MRDSPLDPPGRVVSLCPSITETVAALGAWDCLVGRTRFCVHPADRVGSVADVGGTKAPKLDKILAIEPDLVLFNEEENRKEDAEALKASGIRVASFFPSDVPTTAAYIRRLGALLGKPAEGAALAEELLELRRAIAQELAVESADETRPSCVYLIWRNPWMAAGSGTFISSLIEAGGLLNAVDSEEPYPALSASDIFALDPSVVLLSSEPFPFAEKHRRELASATGLPASRFVLVDGELLSWHGVRTLAGLRYARSLAQQLIVGAAGPNPGGAPVSPPGGLNPG